MLRVDRKAGIIGTGNVIGFLGMPSWLCNVRRKAMEDWLTARKTRRTDHVSLDRRRLYCLFRYASSQALFALQLPSNQVQPRIQFRPGDRAPRRGESSIRCQHKDKRTTLMIVLIIISFWRVRFAGSGMVRCAPGELKPSN